MERALSRARSSPFPGDATDTRSLVPGFFQGDLISNPATTVKPVNAWLTSAPGAGRRVWMYPRILQWCDYFSQRLGLYFALEDPEVEVKGFFLEHQMPSVLILHPRHVLDLHCMRPKCSINTARFGSITVSVGSPTGSAVGKIRRAEEDGDRPDLPGT